MIKINSDVAWVILIVLVLYVLHKVYRYILFPKMINKITKEVEKNPKWITKELHSKYYGFADIDFITAEDDLGVLPRFRVSKEDDTRLEFLIPDDTPTTDIERLGHHALVGKIKLKYGLFFPEKPIEWLSILLFMLEGGEVTIKDIEKRQETN